MPEPTPPTEPAAQRPRTARSREAILQAALELCDEASYAAVTMDGIAARARVGKPTLYRWWPTKTALVMDAVLDAAPPEVFAIPDSGSVVADLRTLCRNVAALLADPRLGPIVVSVIGHSQDDPDAAARIAAVRHATWEPNRVRILAEQQAGRLPAMDPEVLENVLIGPLWFRAFLTKAPLTREFADQVVAAVLGEG